MVGMLKDFLTDDVRLNMEHPQFPIPDYTGMHKLASGQMSTLTQRAWDKRKAKNKMSKASRRAQCLAMNGLSKKQRLQLYWDQQRAHRFGGSVAKMYKIIDRVADPLRNATEIKA